MDNDLTKIKRLFENAVVPLRCVVEDWDYGQKLRLKIYDQDDNGVLELPHILVRNMRDESISSDLIQQIRQEIQSKGFTLANA